MTPLDRFDVIVVGAGPAGSSCATVLAHAGRKVLIMDKAAFPRDKICGECIHPQCWSFFKFLGVDETLMASPARTIHRVSITNSAGRRISVKISNALSAPFVAMKRSLLDKVLLDEARSKGAVFMESALVTNVEWSGEWTVTVRLNGRISIFRADIVIAADGRNSVIARKFSMQSASPTNPRRVAVQWHTSYQPSAGSSLEMFLFRSGYAGIVNVDDSTANIAMVTTPDMATLAAKDFASFLALTLLSNETAALRFKDCISSSYATTFPINPILHKSIHPALYFVGDAHQTVEPFTGEGIFFALQDGVHTASCILSTKSEPGKRPFWSNLVFSPMLQRPFLAESLVSAASAFPIAVPLGFRAIFHRHVLS